MNKTRQFAIQEAYEKGYEDGVKSLHSAEMDWENQNKLREKWLRDNPNAEYEGWMSI